MAINYQPQGVCSRQMQIEVEDGIVAKQAQREMMQNLVDTLEGMPGGRRLPRQPPGHRQTGGGNEGGGRDPASGGDPLRRKAHLLPRSVGEGAEGNEK